MKFYMATLLDYIYNNKSEITEEEFKKMKNEYTFIMKIVWINEKYGMVLDNYYEFISEMRRAERELLEREQGIEKIELGQKFILLFNRKLSNLLCSVRMYIDQTQHDLSTLKIEECSQDDFHKFTAEQYDASIGYQIMELLRNYMQHQGLIIEGITCIRPFVQDIDYFTISINIDYKKLKSIDRYEKKILLDSILANSGANTFNLLWFLDEYISGLDKVHKGMMEKLSGKIASAQKVINQILEKYYGGIDVPEEIGFLGAEQDFLLQYSYVKRVADCIPELKDCYGEKKYFQSADCIKGSFQRNTIKI